MAAGEAIGLKALLHVFPSFIGSALALFLDPPKKSWQIPVMGMVFMGAGEIAGPVLHANVGFLSASPSFSKMVAAALAWSILKLAQRTFQKLDLATAIETVLPGKKTK